MAYARVIAISILVCAVSALPVQIDGPEMNPSNKTEIDYRLPSTTAPIHYDLKINPDIEGDSGFRGESTIHFKVLEPTSDIVLHSVDLEVDEDATRVIYSDGIVLRPKSHTYINETEELVISVDRTLEEGEYWMTMKFSGRYNEELFGFFKSHYNNKKGDKVWVLATQFEATYARYAFPCWDEPALKATFNISLKHADNYTALSNMPARERTNLDEADGKGWTHFERTPVMSTYLVAYVVADYDKISNSDGSINIWSRKDMLPHLKYALKIAEESSKALEQYTNSTVRVPKMDHIALPAHGSGAMENWGLITYPERNLIFDESKHSMSRKYAIATTVAHELAHQWFGNKVSPIWWSHIWLNEGFASYFQHYILDKILKNSRFMDYFVVSVIQDSLVTDTHWHTNPIDTDLKTPGDIDSAFSVAIYNKAPSILHMLSSIVSPKVFQKGIVDYLNKHEYGSADPDCLWRALQSALDQSDVPHSDFNLTEVMNTWIKQKRYPLVTVERNYSTGETKFTQEDFALVDVHTHSDSAKYKDENETYQWWVPITYATKSAPDFSDTGSIKWLKPQENLTVDGIDPDDWIIVNKQQSGYYRVNYDETNWRKLAKYLHSENLKNIHVLNRAQIVSDITSLTLHDRVEPSVFLDVISYLKEEQDYAAWIHLFNFLKRVEHILDFPTAQPIRDFTLSIMENLMNTVGYHESANEDPFTQLKRTEALRLGCFLGHRRCKEIATVRLIQYMNNPDMYKKSPHMAAWMFKNGGRLANESAWNEILEFSIEQNSTELLEALANTEDPELFETYLNLSLKNNTLLPLENKAMIVSAAIMNPVLSSVAIDFWIKNRKEIYEDSDDEYSIMYQANYIILSAEQMEKLEKICEDIPDCEPEKFRKKHERYMAKVKSKVNEWVAAINNM